MTSAYHLLWQQFIHFVLLYLRQLGNVLEVSLMVTANTTWNEGKSQNKVTNFPCNKIGSRNKYKWLNATIPIDAVTTDYSFGRVSRWLNNNKEGKSNRFIFLNIYPNRTSVLFKSELNKSSIQLHHQIIVHGYFRITIQYNESIELTKYFQKEWSTLSHQLLLRGGLLFLICKDSFIVISKSFSPLSKTLKFFSTEYSNLYTSQTSKCSQTAEADLLCSRTLVTKCSS